MCRLGIDIVDDGGGIIELVSVSILVSVSDVDNGGGGVSDGWESSQMRPLGGKLVGRGL